jgi:thymidylate synthase
MEKIEDMIMGQIGSDGKPGWPVCVKDRVSFYQKSRESVKANVAVTFLWTIRDEVIPKLEKENLAIATNFYTPAGLEGMVRNILGNPYIRYLILLGNEYSSKRAEGCGAKCGGPGLGMCDGKTCSELTSANAVRAFFEKGVDKNRKVPGFENAASFDRNIPIEMIELVRKNVQLIDLNKEMDGTLEEKIGRANELIRTLEKKGPFMGNPAVFDFEKSEEPFPYEGGPLVVRSSTIPSTWIEIMHFIYRHGRNNLMNANTDRWVKEINNLVAVIHDPQNLGLSLNPFLVPITMEKIEAYKKEVLTPELPEGKAYTYGNKLRAYLHSNAKEITELVNSLDYKDFEFGKGSHLDKNIKYTGSSAEIDQIQDIVDVLKRDLYSKACVAVTWHAEEELMRKHKSSPCLVFLQAVVQDEKLNLTVFFRSHDMVQGWPENAYGCAGIQKFIADGVGVEPGLLTIMSGSAQIYRHYYKQVGEMLGKFRSGAESFSDPHGNFIIKVGNGNILVLLLDPKTGKELEKYSGKTAKELYTQIAFRAGGLEPGHLMYIGYELGRAEHALRAGLGYEQDAALGFDIGNARKS